MNRFTVSLFAFSMITVLANAHDGRRYEVLVEDGRLAALGYNSTGTDDGAGAVRPYYNAMHDHWSNLGSGVGAAADLPGFDLFTPGDLVGSSLTLELVGSSKWVSPGHAPKPGTVPDVVPLEEGEEVYVTYGLETISTIAPGSFELVASVPSGGAVDLDLAYDTLIQPSDVIVVLEFRLSTDAPGVQASETVHVLLSPDGANPAERLHHASLYLENFLGTPVCAADLASPADGVVDFTDVLAFLVAFGDASPEADLALPIGTFDFTDVLAFLGVFGAGCP